MGRRSEEGTAAVSSSPTAGDGGGSGDDVSTTKRVLVRFDTYNNLARIITGSRYDEKRRVKKSTRGYETGRSQRESFSDIRIVARSLIVLSLMTIAQCKRSPLAECKT